MPNIYTLYHITEVMVEHLWRGWFGLYIKLTHTQKDSDKQYMKGTYDECGLSAATGLCFDWIVH